MCHVWRGYERNSRQLIFMLNVVWKVHSDNMCDIQWLWTDVGVCVLTHIIKTHTDNFVHVPTSWFSANNISLFSYVQKPVRSVRMLMTVSPCPLQRERRGNCQLKVVSTSVYNFTARTHRKVKMKSTQAPLAMSCCKATLNWSVISKKINEEIQSGRIFTPPIMYVGNNMAKPSTLGTII